MNSPCSFADLRILATSDVHMHLTGWDALRDIVRPTGGMDRLARRITAARSAAPGTCLLLDNGDAVQGTPVGTVCARPPLCDGHPWPAVVRALDYDAVGLGNHDFDFGLPFLQSIVAQMAAPALCASLASGAVAGVSPTVLLPRSLVCCDGISRPIRIGVTSVLPPQTAMWNHRHVSGRISFDSGADAARRAVGQLRTDGADIVIMLCHSGLPSCGDDDSENFAATLARDVPGIDAMIMGHTHQKFPVPGGAGDVHGVPAVMPGYGGEALGVIDLRLCWDGHVWQVTDHDTALHTPQATDLPQPEITALAAPAIAATNTALDVQLTTSATGLHSYFDMLCPGLSGTVVARTMTRCIAAHVAGTDLADLPLIASVAPMALGGRAGPDNYVEIAPGAVRARHVAMLAPYPNAIWAIRMNGVELRLWAERSAAFFATSTQAQRQLVDPDAPSFNFDALHGLEARIDPFRPAMFDVVGRVIDPHAGRVQTLTYRGVPVELTQQFLVAVTSYRGAGGGGFPGVPDEQRVLRTDVDLLTALQDDVATASFPTAPVRPAWRFATAGDTRVVIQTSPNARAHLGDIAQFDPQVVGINAAGFLELTVAI